jgi:protein phosphatase
VTRLAWGSATDTGRIRQANEDALLTVDGLYAVADGMGGHQAGEVASHLALETLKDAFDTAGTDVLVAAVEQANTALVERAAGNSDLTGMGTTLCAMALVEVNGSDAVAVVNVGDSRLYLLSDGELLQITEDHSLVATLQRQGRITVDEAAVHPQRNILTRALGIDGRVLVDSWEIIPVIGDRYLLCSDGLFNEVDESRIASVLRRLADPTDAALELVRLANESAGRDNITCVIVDILDDAGRDPAPVGDSRITSRSLPVDPALAASMPSPAPVDPSEGSESAGSSMSRVLMSSITWRVGLFVGSLLVLALFVLGFIWWTGNRTYFVGTDGSAVVIYRGKPGGLLWIEPELVESTELILDEVPGASRAAVTTGVEEPSLSAARQYVNNLRDQIERQTPTPTPKSSTSTSSTSSIPSAAITPATPTP